jgi:hypothetical protein
MTSDPREHRAERRVGRAQLAKTSTPQVEPHSWLVVDSGSPR